MYVAQTDDVVVRIVALVGDGLAVGADRSHLGGNRRLIGTGSCPHVGLVFSVDILPVYQDVSARIHRRRIPIAKYRVHCILSLGRYRKVSPGRYLVGEHHHHFRIQPDLALLVKNRRVIAGSFDDGGHSGSTAGHDQVIACVHGLIR